MTEQEITERLAVIRQSRPDYEVVHGQEDDLLWDFVLAISQENGQFRASAQLLLAWQQESLGEPRWCA